MNKWGFEDNIELINCIRKGLPAYTPYLKPVKFEGIVLYAERKAQRRIQPLTGFVRSYGILDAYYERRYTAPVYEDYVEKIPVRFEDLLFKLPEVMEFEEKHKIRESLRSIEQKHMKRSPTKLQRAQADFKNKCREMAEKQWQKEQEWTNPEMAQWILGFFTNGYEYDKTKKPLTVKLSAVIGYIKEFNPNRNPGRRKGK
jgi:predicted transcriptional regulator